MGHLNELHDAYAHKGLTILAVSNEATSAIEAFIEEFGPKFPILIDAGNAMEDYGAGGYPSSFLIGPEGDIVWAGHPGNLNNEIIDEHIGGVQLLPEIPKSLKTVEKAMKKGKYGDALKKVEKLITAGRLKDGDDEVAEKMRALIDGIASKGLERASKDLQAGKVYKAFLAYEDIERKFKGHDYSKKAKAEVKRVEGVKAYKMEIKASEKWANIKPKLKDIPAKKALALLKPLLSKKYADTKAGQKAAAKERELKHAIR